MMEKTHEEIIKEILDQAKELKEIRDEIGCMAEGNYYLSIELNADFDKNKYYEITASKIVEATCKAKCHIRLDGEMWSPIRDDDEQERDRLLTEACLWFFNVIKEFEKAPWLNEEELLAEADFIMNELDPK